MSGRTEVLARSLTPVVVLALFGAVVAAAVGAAPDRRAPRKEAAPASRLAELRKSYDKIAASQRDLEARLASLNAEQDRLRAEFGDRGAEGAAPPSARAPQPDATPMRAVIRAVDNKQDVYVISTGAKQGVRPGMEFEVRRDDRVVGVIVIDATFQNYASAKRKPGSATFRVAPDDECVAAPLGK